MALVAYDPCGTPPGAHTEDANCLEEGSRIVGAMAVKVGFDIETIVDQITFDAAVTAADIIPIKKLAGNWTEPTRNTRPGTSQRETEFASFTFNIPFRHYGVDANMRFWNAINQSKGYSMVFIFEDFKAWAAMNRSLDLIGMDIAAAPVSDDELGGSRRMQGTANWKYRDLPYLLDLPADLLSANFNV